MCCLPPLPRRKELVSELGPLHAKLASQSTIAKRHPVYKCSEVQVFTDYCTVLMLKGFVSFMKA